MKLEWVYIAMWRAMYELQQEQFDEELAYWIGPANPYNTTTHQAFVHAYQDEFDAYARKHGDKQDYATDESLQLVADFVAECYPDWGDRFKGITAGEWRNLCSMVEKEEDSRVVS